MLGQKHDDDYNDFIVIKSVQLFNIHTMNSKKKFVKSLLDKIHCNNYLDN